MTQNRSSLSLLKTTLRIKKRTKNYTTAFFYHCFIFGDASFSKRRMMERRITNNNNHHEPTMMTSTPNNNNDTNKQQYYWAIRQCDSLKSPAIFSNWEDCSFYLDASENDVQVDYRKFNDMEGAVAYAFKNHTTTTTTTTTTPLFSPEEPIIAVIPTENDVLCGRGVSVCVCVFLLFIFSLFHSPTTFFNSSICVSYL